MPCRGWSVKTGPSLAAAYGRTASRWNETSATGPARVAAEPGCSSPSGRIAHNDAKRDGPRAMPCTRRRCNERQRKLPCSTDSPLGRPGGKAESELAFSQGTAPMVMGLRVLISTLLILTPNYESNAAYDKLTCRCDIMAAASGPNTLTGLAPLAGDRHAGKPCAGLRTALLAARDRQAETMKEARQCASRGLRCAARTTICREGLVHRHLAGRGGDRIFFQPPAAGIFAGPETG